MNNRTTIKTSLLAIIISLWWCMGCDDIPLLPLDPEGSGSGGEGDIPQESRVSDCGGFDSNPSALMDETANAKLDYCDAEKINWYYNAETETLSVVNTRVLLNCCGERKVTIEQSDDGVYLITEIDDPEPMGNGETSRCHCVCVFDLELQATDIPEEEIAIKVVRDVEEAETLETIWEGTLDLSLTTGSIVINEDDLGTLCGSEK
jgi:hypothetical protein